MSNVRKKKTGKEKEKKKGRKSVGEVPLGAPLSLVWVARLVG
jgi:hypothetical protein